MRAKRKNKSRKLKRGGKKNNNNTARFVTQMAGNPFSYNTLLTPSPLPSSTFQKGGVSPSNISAQSYSNLDLRSLALSLQNFGDTITTFNTATLTGKLAAADAVAAANSQVIAASNMNLASQSLLTAFVGTPDGTTRGLYKALMGSNVTFVAK